jgi:hypothetical protein
MPDIRWKDWRGGDASLPPEAGLLQLPPEPDGFQAGYHLHPEENGHISAELLKKV